MTLRLEPFDPDVRALTRDTVIASRGKTPAMSIRCASCQAELGRICIALRRPLFTSWWQTEGGGDDLAGVVAVLALPPGYPNDYPALLVRCGEHGDTVLDHIDTLKRLRARQPVLQVQTTFPRLEHRPLADDWLGDMVEAAPTAPRLRAHRRLARRLLRRRTSVSATP